VLAAVVRVSKRTSPCRALTPLSSLVIEEFCGHAARRVQFHYEAAELSLNWPTSCPTGSCSWHVLNHLRSPGDIVLSLRFDDKNNMNISTWTVLLSLKILKWKINKLEKMRMHCNLRYSDVAPVYLWPNLYCACAQTVMLRLPTCH